MCPTNSNIAAVTIAVGIGPPPLLQNDGWVVWTTEVLEGSVADNDYGIDAGSIELITGPAHGDFSFDEYGNFLYDPDDNGNGTYEPAEDYVGADYFTYTATSGGRQLAPATVTLNVIVPAWNEPVSAVWVSPWGYPHGPALRFDVAHGQYIDLPLRGQTGLVEYAGPVSPDYATYTVALATDGAHGEVTQNPDGSLRYTAEGDFMGWDSFTYTVSDGTHTSAPVNVAVHVTNGLPMPEDVVLTVPWLEATGVSASSIIGSAADPDGDALTIEIVGAPQHGDLTPDGNGGFAYTPHEDYIGPDFFTYRLLDGVTLADFGGVGGDVFGSGTGAVLLQVQPAQPLNVTVFGHVIAVGATRSITVRVTDGNGIPVPRAVIDASLGPNNQNTFRITGYGAPGGRGAADRTTDDNGEATVIVVANWETAIGADLIVKATAKGLSASGTGTVTSGPPIITVEGRATRRKIRAAGPVARAVVHRATVVRPVARRRARVGRAVSDDFSVSEAVSGWTGGIGRRPRRSGGV